MIFPDDGFPVPFRRAGHGGLLRIRELKVKSPDEKEEKKMYYNRDRSPGVTFKRDKTAPGPIFTSLKRRRRRRRNGPGDFPRADGGPAPF